MELFFHHVGQNGSSEDFPKTIYRGRLILEVEKSLLDENPEKYHLINELKLNFPSERFNCWGVPEGAKSIIKNLKVGDTVLLVQSSRIDGRVPILCKVKVYLPVRLNELSKMLWGDDKYPFIFFFDAEEIDLMWIDFRDHLGYMERFDPRGKFYKVAQERLNKYGSIHNYIEFLLSHYTHFKKSDIYVEVINVKNAVKEKNKKYGNNINSEIDSLFEQQTNIPKLTSEQLFVKEPVLLAPRDEAFRRIVKKIYNNSCSVCGSSLVSPNGEPEVQSAHIYPKALNGNDDIRNGICLCRFHHWAFDCGWFSIADSYKIVVNKNILNFSKYYEITKYDGLKIKLPIKLGFAPHKIYLKEHRKFFGFE